MSTLTETIQASTETTCARCGSTISKGDKCFWIYGKGTFCEESCLPLGSPKANPSTDTLRAHRDAIKVELRRLLSELDQIDAALDARDKA